MLEEAYLFDFFQLLHLLETEAGSPVPLGRGGPFRSEAIRLRPDASLLFPPSDVRRVEAPARIRVQRGPDDERAWDWVDIPHRITVNFMGLYGTAAPTPIYFTELITSSDVETEAKVPELVDFLDLFNHRVLSLFWRAWLKYRYPYRWQPGAGDEVSNQLLSFIGLGDPQTRQRTGLPASRLLRYLGLLALRTRPPVGLEILLSDHFGVAVQVQERVFRWVAIPPEGHNRIGVANTQLGTDLSIGERVPDRAGKIRVSLGPLHFDEYLGFLPGTGRFRELCALIHLWIGERFEFDVELVVRREEVPEMVMGEASVTRLGWTSWSTSAPGLAVDPRIVFPGMAPRTERASA